MCAVYVVALTGSAISRLNHSCQGKDARVLFKLNYSIYEHALALDVIKIIDGKNFAKVR